MNRITRRRFLSTCSGTLAACAGAPLGQAHARQAMEAGASSQDLLVVVFLRGGWDALSVVAPLAGPDRAYYEAARPNLQIPVSQLLQLDDRFGLHPSLAPLFSLYQQDKLAVVHAVGLPTDTRSHFDAQLFIELGTPGRKSAPQGWLTRHLQSTPVQSPNALLPAVAAGLTQPASLLGNTETAVIDQLGNFALNGSRNYANAQRVALRAMYGHDHWLYRAGTAALDAADVIAYLGPGTYQPGNGAEYPQGPFGNQLQTIAQIARLNAGLGVATSDLGGWDTHTDQGDTSTGRLTALLETLAKGLAALYLDLQGTRGLTVIVQSEFGRRLRENANRGCDHGHGGVMLALGDGINGGAVFGEWPGLSTDQLYDNADLAVTTDYRQILAELISVRLQNPNIATVFPSLGAYTPLGIARSEQ